MGNTNGSEVMGNPPDALSSLDLNRLEQVVLTMPEVRFYFAGDREQQAGNLRAFLDGQELELLALHPFASTGEGICYYILLDISASIPTARFRQITAGLAELCQTMDSGDRVVFLTFGDEVTLLFDESGTALQGESAANTIAQLTNTDQNTLLFEAVKQMAELSKGISSQDYARKAAFVITDGDDFSTGAATRDEALQTLGTAGIPVYGFTADNAKRDSINAFGEFARATGGNLTILEDGAASSSFSQVRQSMLESYEAVFTADSNLVANALVDVTLELTSEGERQQRQAMQSEWIADTVRPVIDKVVQEGPRQLRVTFSEPVDGLEAAEHFRLTGQDTGNTSPQIPAYASAGGENDSVLLTFSDDLAGGSYELSCQNIFDHSMERNALEGSALVTVEARPTPDEEGPGFFQSYGWLISLGGVILLALVLFLAWRRFKKRKALVVVEDKAVLKSNTRTQYHVAVETETSKLPEKTVYVHVEGQREEIPVLIRGSMIVGRASTCELIFDDPALSRQHFALELRDGAVLLTNLSGTGFTAVNGVRLGTQPYPLKSGDQVSAGQLKLRIRW